MKKNYIAPSVEVELFEMDSSIAANCSNVVSAGPAMGDHEVCSEFINWPVGAKNPRGVTAVTFYEDTNCDCYTTGGNYGFWTS